MSILVDAAVWPLRGDRWAHLISDASYEELHAFAQGLGIPRRGFQGDHYDVPSALREAAILSGAEAVDSRELVRRLRESGLRAPRRVHTGAVLSEASRPEIRPSDTRLSDTRLSETER